MGGVGILLLRREAVEVPAWSYLEGFLCDMPDLWILGFGEFIFPVVRVVESAGRLIYKTLAGLMQWDSRENLRALGVPHGQVCDNMLTFINSDVILSDVL